MMISSYVYKIIQSILSIFLALFIGLSFTLVASENPLDIFLILIQTTIATPYDLGTILSYSAPLILTGLSVAVAFKAGLFNIGAEGQLVIGGLAAVCVGIFFPNVPSLMAPFFAITAALIAGGLWGGVAGFFKARRGAHEVITTIMLNFIAAGIASYFTVYLLKDSHSQNPQTMPVANQYLLYRLDYFQGAHVSSAIFITVIIALLTWVFLYKTPWGFEMRAVGESESASKSVGIKVPNVQFLSLFLAGGLAGIVGAIEVLGRMGCFKLDFSPGYGFTGIAVAFLAKGNPIGIVLSALLLGALCKGASDLEIYSQGITSDLSMILQALLILAVASESIWSRLISKIYKKGF
ncbi:MAG: ABC transporter permease [Silvanigrellaceae bacterium]|nr:ABC transporter permease [Silvanigrellaceae bacterium]